MDTRWIWTTVTYFVRLYLAMAVGCATSIKRSMLRFLGEASGHMLSVQIFKERWRIAGLPLLGCNYCAKSAIDNLPLYSLYFFPFAAQVAIYGTVLILELWYILITASPLLSSFLVPCSWLYDSRSRCTCLLHSSRTVTQLSSLVTLLVSSSQYCSAVP